MSPLFLTLTLALLTACSDGDGSNSSPVIEPPREPLALTFTDAPIDISGINAQFVEDIAYDSYAKTRFDIFLPDTDEPTPLVIYIHGGGFTGGDKSKAYAGSLANDIRQALANGVAYASLNYRLLDTVDTEGVIKPLEDNRRALQFIRYHAQDLNIDPQAIAIYGSSAGAGTSLWLAFHDDMANTDNADPILRESTRISAVGAVETQASYDIYRWESDVFLDYELTIEAINALSPELEQRMFSFYGVASATELESARIAAYRADVDMLALMSIDDPDMWLRNGNQPLVFPSNTGLLFHHAYHARELKKRADAIGLANVSYIPELGIADPSGETVIGFLLGRIR
jgi:hypothetical protein